MGNHALPVISTKVSRAKPWSSNIMKNIGMQGLVDLPFVISSNLESLFSVMKGYINISIVGAITFTSGIIWQFVVYQFVLLSFSELFQLCFKPFHKILLNCTSKCWAEIMEQHESSAFSVQGGHQLCTIANTNLQSPRLEITLIHAI